MRSTFSSIFILALTALPARAANFGPGERLDFNVSYMGLGTGRCALRIDPARGENARTWPIVFEGGTHGLFDVYRIKEQVTSLWDADGKRVVELTVASQHGGTRSQSHARLDESGGKFHVVRTRDGKQSTLAVPVESGVQDLTSALFYLRTRNLGIGDTEEFPVFTGKKVARFSARVVKREWLSTPAGSFTALKVRARVELDGKFKSKRDMVIWFSDDERRIPLRIEADFQLGSMTAELTKYAP